MKTIEHLPPSKYGYRVKCVCQKYETGPLFSGIAETAARMHEMIGSDHNCYFESCRDNSKYVLKSEEIKETK